jgi:PPOX class probable F420-dependent enzyme
VTTAPRPEPFGAPPSYGTGKEEPGTLLPWHEVERWIAKSRNYWVSTTRADGRPHAMPVWGVWLERALWFSTHPESVKGRNIARDPRIVLHLESGDDVAILEGAAEPHDPAALEAFIDAYERKYGYRIETGDRTMGIHRLPPSSVVAWREADFPGSATRWVFD